MKNAEPDGIYAVTGSAKGTNMPHCRQDYKEIEMSCKSLAFVNPGGDLEDISISLYSWRQWGGTAAKTLAAFSDSASWSILRERNANEIRLWCCHGEIGDHCRQVSLAEM